MLHCKKAKDTRPPTADGELFSLIVSPEKLKIQGNLLSALYNSLHNLPYHTPATNLRIGRTKSDVSMARSECEGESHNVREHRWRGISPSALSSMIPISWVCRYNSPEVPIMLDSLTGKVAVVTGGGRGIGRAIAFGLAQAGADVAVIYRSRENEARETCGQIEQIGRRTVAIRADVSVAADVDRLVRTVEGEIGPVAILINNAGVTRLSPSQRSPSRIGTKSSPSRIPRTAGLSRWLSGQGRWALRRSTASTVVPWP